MRKAFADLVEERPLTAEEAPTSGNVQSQAFAAIDRGQRCPARRPQAQRFERSSVRAPVNRLRLQVRRPAPGIGKPQARSDAQAMGRHIGGGYPQARNALLRQNEGRLIRLCGKAGCALVAPGAPETLGFLTPRQPDSAAFHCLLDSTFTQGRFGAQQIDRPRGRRRDVDVQFKR